MKSLFRNPEIETHYESPRRKAEQQHKKLRKVSSNEFNFHFVTESEDSFDENHFEMTWQRHLTLHRSCQQNQSGAQNVRDGMLIELTNTNYC